MRETLKEYGKYIIGIALIVYFVISLIFKENSFLDNLDLTTTITLIFCVLYSQVLWRYNPLEKTPKIFGEYEAQFISTYDKIKRKMNFKIKQDLLSTRIYVTTKESKSESLTSSLKKKTDNWQLVYTYQNIPNLTEREHSEIHFGTCMLNIVNNNITNGTYYTDIKTNGDIKYIKKI